MTKAAAAIDPSQPLPSAKHEAYAQHLSTGMAKDKAYKEAGFKQDRGAASRLSANVNIQARVKHLQARQVETTQHIAAINTRAEFQTLREMVAEARAAKDFKTALAGQQFLLECFGYKDQPTLTHDHMTDRQQSAPAEPEETDVVQVTEHRITGQLLRFDRSHKEVKRITSSRKR